MMQIRAKFSRNAVVCAVALSPALALCCNAHSQTTPSGQVARPNATGSRSGSSTNCGGQDGVTAASGVIDPSCGELGPNFATPLAVVPVPQRVRHFTGIVRIDAVVPPPSGTTPDTDSLSVVGSATVLRTRRTGLKECLYTGKNWSTKAGASTFTACMDNHGEIVAYQDCKVSPGESQPACSVVTPRDTPKAAADTKAQ